MRPGPALAVLALAAALWAALWAPGTVRAQSGPLAGEPHFDETSGTLAAQAPEGILYPGEGPGLILVVFKAIQQLHIYRHDGQGNLYLVKILPCSTGQAHGDKLVRGDKKTPEGYYIFRQKLLPSEVPDIYGILAYPMDYPNFWDRAVGRGGDGIWTHGINKPLVDYDSEGCIELLNHDLAELEPLIKLLDTPILVYDNYRLQDAATLKAEGERVLRFLERWRDAWSGEDMVAYEAMYDPSFSNSDSLSWRAWMDKKRRLAQGYQNIEVTLENVRVYRHRDTVVASFTQVYNGDNRFTSVGLKRLYLKEDGDGGYLIFAEEFSPLPGPQPEKWLTASQREWALTTPPLAVAQVSSPAAAASAGVLIPPDIAPPVLLASAAGDSDEAAAEETARAAIESRSASGPVVALASLDGGIEPPGPNPELLDDPEPDPMEASTAEPDTEPDPEPAPEPAAAAPEPPKTAERAAASAPASKSPAEATPAAEPVSTAEATPAAEPKSPDIETVATVAALPRESSSDASPAAAPSAPEQNLDEADLDEPAPAPLDEGSVTDLLEAWVDAWSAQDAETYFSLYAPDFYFPDQRLHLPAFKRLRGGHMSRAAFVKVGLSDLKVVLEGDRAVATFTQTYESDRAKDRGRKTLELTVQDGRWLITGESFQPLS